MDSLRSWRFRVYGLPRPQKRARVFAGKDGKIHAIDPQVSKDWKGSVALQALAAKPEAPTDKALSLSVIFLMPRPRSSPKKRPPILHTKRPDLDNLVKAILDAIRGIYYRDDAQITEQYCRKMYHDIPGVVVKLEEIDDFQWFVSEVDSCLPED